MNDNKLPAQLFGIAQCCRRPAATLPVVHSQQKASGFHQLTVPVQHTAVVVLAAYVSHRICPI